MTSTCRAVSLALVSAALAAGLASAGARAQDATTLRLHHLNSPKSISHEKFMVPWAKDVEKKSGGKLKIQVFPAMQLGGKPTDLYDQARDGVVDMIWTLPGYTPGRFPITEVFELPFLSQDAISTSLAMNAFYPKWLKDEYKDTHPLLLHSAAPAFISTSKKPVNKLEDVSGLKIRAPSKITGDFIKAAGGTSVGMPIPAVYEAVSRGVVDGMIVPWTIMRPFRLQDVTEYHTMASFSPPLFILTMNNASYAKLPAAQRKLLDDATGMALARQVGELWQDDEKPGHELAIKKGNKVITLGAEERARWEKLAEPLIAEWMKKIDGMGIDAKAMVADARRLIAQYAKK